MNNLRLVDTTTISSSTSTHSSSLHHDLNHEDLHYPEKCFCKNCKVKINENQIMSICLNCSLSSQQSVYILCSHCKQEQGKHHQKRGHCFCLVFNRKFKYSILQRFGLLDRKISKNGVLVADQYCKDYELFTKPKDALNNDDLQLVHGKIVHRGVTCDGCECSIHGTRFSCLNCSNFDFCSLCMKTHLGNIQNLWRRDGSQKVNEKKDFNSHPFNHLFLQTALPITNHLKKNSESINVDLSNIDHSTQGITSNDIISTENNSIDLRPTEKTVEILIYPFSDQTDLDVLYNIECSCFSKPFDRQYLYKVFRQSLLNNQEKPIDHFTWIAHTRNVTNNWFAPLHISGYITYSINKEKQRCEITSFAVHPNCRKKGIGKELLRFTIQHVLKHSWMWKNDLTNSQLSIDSNIDSKVNQSEEISTSYNVTSSSNDHVIVNIDKLLVDNEEEECKYWNNHSCSQRGYLMYWRKSLWIQLHVSSFNLPAQRLYTKFGFKATSFIDDYYHSEVNIAQSHEQASDQGDGVLMVLSLTSNQFIL